jgi:polyisoprenoid-binding protein YceI
VTSDESRRDGLFNGRIMETATYPTATFTLTEPIELGSIPAAGEQRTFRATGDLTLHGVTKSVTFELTGQLTGSIVQVAGSIPITFADWNIANPSFGLAQTEDNGSLEFLLDFAHA